MKSALGLMPLLFGGDIVFSGDIVDGSKTIDEKSIAVDLFDIARLEMEGRGSPSAGQRRAADIISARFKEFGLEPADDAESVLAEFDGRAEPVVDADDRTQVSQNLYLRPFSRGLEAPVPEDCSFSYELEGKGGAQEARYGVDWVPVVGCAGSFSGELVFAGFGIHSKGDRYNDFAGLDLSGNVAVIIDGEPRHKRKFDGPELSDSASLWDKLEGLQDAGVEGVLVIRRGLELPKGKRSEFEPLPLGYRYSHASFAGDGSSRPPRRRPPVVEISQAFADQLIGKDTVVWAEKVDRSGSPKKLAQQACEVSVKSALRLQQVRVDNVVGVLRGSDPALADEYVVLGAHYDHIGVGIGGRVGPGADDNGSGASGLLALTKALARSKPARSVLICAFSGEEAGLLGSKALCASPPVEVEQMVAMLNMDMIGRGEAAEVAVLGTKQNPSLEALLRDANKLGKTGVKKLVTGKGDDLWRRSDHYSFHAVGVPTLFFFEGLPISRNADYHTWRDVVDEVDTKKIRNTCRLVHQTLCLIANDESRPPAPRSAR